MPSPIAVLISDIHFNLNTLPLASASLRQAVAEAERLRVPLVIAGDLHDTKAILRGECVSEIISILKDRKISIYVLIGNHDKIHEKSEAHALEFLTPYVNIVKAPVYMNRLGWMIPYQHDPDILLKILDSIRSSSVYPIQHEVIMHQGISGAFMGEYVIDKTSLPAEAYRDLKVVSGHYHRHQMIKVPNGSFEYIGTPYTISFAEANDGPKGFQILMNDWSMRQVETNLRKHVILETTIDLLPYMGLGPDKDDLLWLKITGFQSELDKMDKKAIGIGLLGHSNFKLDLIPTDGGNLELEAPSSSFTVQEILDKLIDNMAEPEEHKSYLKVLYQEVMDETTSR